jgi:hypothetical protein
MCVLIKPDFATENGGGGVDQSATTSFFSHQTPLTLTVPYRILDLSGFAGNVSIDRGKKRQLLWRIDGRSMADRWRIDGGSMAD